jgi:hypothetical protein
MAGEDVDERDQPEEQDGDDGHVLRLPSVLRPCPYPGGHGRQEQEQHEPE